MVLVEVLVADGAGVGVGVGVGDWGGMTALESGVLIVSFPRYGLDQWPWMALEGQSQLRQQAREERKGRMMDTIDNWKLSRRTKGTEGETG